MKSEEERKEKKLVSIKPILFNTEMVKAILDGRKTMTRRVVKEKGWRIIDRQEFAIDGFWFFVCEDGKEASERTATCHKLKPPCQIGDIMCVRETFRIDYLSKATPQNTQKERPCGKIPPGRAYIRHSISAAAALI